MATDAANKIDYIEFQAADIAATKKFFEQLFGWKFTDYGPDYTSFEDGRIAGGFSKSDKRSTVGAGGPNHFKTSSRGGWPLPVALAVVPNGPNGHCNQ